MHDLGGDEGSKSIDDRIYNMVHSDAAVCAHIICAKTVYKHVF